MLAMLLGAHTFISHSILNCHKTVFTGFCSWHCVKQACALLVCAGFMVFKLVPYKNAAWAWCTKLSHQVLSDWKRLGCAWGFTVQRSQSGDLQGGAVHDSGSFSFVISRGIGTLLLCKPLFLESFNLPYICNQVVSTSLPFSKSLDDWSHGFVTCLCCLLAFKSLIDPRLVRCLSLFITQWC